MRSELLNWLASQQNQLDAIIAKTAETYLEEDKDRRSNFIFDIREANSEQYALSRGEDLCYDRPSVGLIYSLWYHGRRVNTCLQYLINVFCETQEEQIDFFDLGSGTGAVQWAVGLIYVGIKMLNFVPPRLNIVNIDNSPFMLEYHQRLWSNFVSHYNQCSEVECAYHIDHWSNRQISHPQNSWFCASYLFDSQENQNAIEDNYIELIERYMPNILVFLTSNQISKTNLLERVSLSMEKLGYSEKQNSLHSQIFSGELIEVNKIRQKYAEKYNIQAWHRKSQWNDRSFAGKVLIRSKNREKFRSIKNLGIYHPPITQRGKIELTEKQQKAARYSEKPSIITGSAGSGKSIVLTEKIKNLVESKNYDPSLSILVTTFNKVLIEQLGNWLEEILDCSRCKRYFNINNKGDSEVNNYFCFLSSSENFPNIQLMNFDVLPTRVGKLKGKSTYEKYDIEQISKIVSEVKKTRNSQKNEENIFNPDFLLEEFHRVFYGLNYRNQQSYVNGIRLGRGVFPRLTKEKKEIVWLCLSKYYDILEKYDIHNFTRIRIEFLKKLSEHRQKKHFTHIFVDEFQDCTQADFEIFYKLLDNPNHLVLAGDLSQSIHLGRSYFIPRASDMKQRQIFRLEGSHRLPYRISECLKKLSKRIVIKHKDGRDIPPDLISPYKASPPGARPIVVFASTVGSIAEKIKEIFKTYQDGYDLNQITILEKDRELCSVLRKSEVNAETDTILRIKGLEKKCILWSVRKEIANEKETEETIYTILTRTSSILIIALSGKIDEATKNAIATLEVNRLIFWDRETKERYSEYYPNKLVEPEPPVDE